MTEPIADMTYVTDGNHLEPTTRSKRGNVDGAANRTGNDAQ
jgi:hypothetical protein